MVAVQEPSSAAEPPSELTPEEAAAAQREAQVKVYMDAFNSDPANRDRALAEVHIMLGGLHQVFSQMYEQFSKGGGGLGAILKMMKG